MSTFRPACAARSATASAAWASPVLPCSRSNPVIVARSLSIASATLVAVTGRPAYSMDGLPDGERHQDLLRGKGAVLVRHRRIWYREVRPCGQHDDLAEPGIADAALLNQAPS